MKRYKDILVGNGDLSKALSEKDENLASKIYKETTQRAIDRYGKDDYAWFMGMSKREVPYANA